MKARAAILVSVLVAACGGGPRTAPTPATSAAPYEGTWTGQTDQAQHLMFAVVGNQIRSVNFSFAGAGTDPSCSGAGGFGGGGPFGTISNGAFSATFATGGFPAFNWTLTGTFISTTAATGTLEVTFTPQSSGGSGLACSNPLQTSWSAQKGS